jgi:hypothetical protein
VYFINTIDLTDLIVELERFQQKIKKLENSVNSAEFPTRLTDESKSVLAEAKTLLRQKAFVNRVGFWFWLINNPIVVGLTFAIVSVLIQVLVSDDPGNFSFTGNTNWIIPILVSAFAALTAGLSKQYEKVQEGGDSMLLSQLQDAVDRGIEQSRLNAERLDNIRETSRLEREGKDEKLRLEREATLIEQRKADEKLRLEREATLIEQRKADEKLRLEQNQAEEKLRLEREAKLEAARIAEHERFMNYLDQLTKRLDSMNQVQ